MWATKGINQDVANVILLAAFMIFGSTTPLKVMNFLWSNTMFLIVFTNLLSVGIMKTGVIDVFWASIVKKFSGSVIALIAIPFVLGTVLIFLIPQAFARVIILGTIYNSIFKSRDEKGKRAKSIIILAGFLGIAVSYMMFSNGDIVLNQAAINFSGETIASALNFTLWAKLMAVPTVLVSLIMVFVLYMVFKSELEGFDRSSVESYEKKESLSKSTRTISLITVITVILLWMTESLHGIPSHIPAAAAVAVLFLTGVLKKKDLRSINIHFLLFLTTAFSIGKVLGQAGISEKIFKLLEKAIPSSSTPFLMIIIGLVIMGFHMMIGSSVATLSVVLPIFIPLAESNGINPVLITLIAYILVNIHFIMPHQHALMMIGYGENYYETKDLIRIGLVMTVLAPLIVQFIYMPWWNLVS